jgi:hypothetical protein
MPVKFEWADGTYFALGWGLRQRGQPIVSVSFPYGGRRVVMLASPAQARGWMADTLRQEGAEDLADALRLAAWEAMKLLPWRPTVRPGCTLSEDDAPSGLGPGGASHAGTRRDSITA